MEVKRFAYFWAGMFFLLSSLSLTILMVMFIFVWQPIWTAGFKDFHTISEAIDRLDQTAKPVSDIAPSMLLEITAMNGSIGNIESNMLAMRDSMKNLEELNPNIVRMNYSMGQMTDVMAGQMGRMNREVDQMGDKMSPYGMMPFNW